MDTLEERGRSKRRRSASDLEEQGAPPFGPGFFLGQLRAFARDRCPDPTERLPAVTVHLAAGEDLELCHVIGLAPGFVALAVRERASGSGRMVMRTELVPYSYVTRVTIRPVVDGGKQVGFNSEPTPPVIDRFSSPEEALRCAGSAGSVPDGPPPRPGR